jgi:CubicO group peptidase (beta-lactamase class C family)/lysophospholipase L1-like esterase
MIRTALFIILWLSLPVAGTVARAATPDSDSAVDALFAEWTDETPGCAVGVSQRGEILLERAYGSADLEHGIPNRPDTIFEAGSVSKQFTAAAVLLLAKDGRLSLDDPVRRYLPELPYYASPVTIRQMLQHTSGLRDWGSIAWIAGAPRGTRAYTHAHVLDILKRQESLNFAPGTRWSYSNSGYNLAAVLLSRVSGEPFAEFTRRRLFEPAGMTRTSWRDDYTRVVKDRAIAYAASDGRYVLDMPFENVHGNGGLLTTVGDLLRWNDYLASPPAADADWVRTMHTGGVLEGGGATGYAFGLGIGRYKGRPEVRHSGTTGSYRAFLARYPDEGLSIAVLCNAGDSKPRQVLRAVADLYLEAAPEPDPAPATLKLPAAALDAIAGLYRNIDRGDVIRIERAGDGLSLGGETPLIALSPSRLTDGEGTTFEMDGAGRALMDEGTGAPVVLERVTQASPTAVQLEELAGRYASTEAETAFVAQVRDGALELLQRPDIRYPLTPLYPDAFDSEIGTIVFRRDAAGAVTALSVVQDRVWDLRFRREDAPVRRVLVFGDSNTWGWVPVERGIPTTRYPADVRWPGVAQAALGDGFEIIEEGLSGRTTDLFDADPTVRELSGAGLDGSAYLPAAVASHLPLDLVVIMLGTNDLKAKFDRSPEAIALGVRGLIERVRRIDRGAWTEYPAPRVLVLAPPPLVLTDRFPAAILAGGVEKSRALGPQLAAVAADAGAAFLDAGAITQADGVDGIHLSAAAHRKIGLAVAERIRELLR